MWTSLPNFSITTIGQKHHPVSAPVTDIRGHIDSSIAGGIIVQISMTIGEQYRFMWSSRFTCYMNFYKISLYMFKGALSAKS